MADRTQRAVGKRPAALLRGLLLSQEDEPADRSD
jgi:hypothetical protein